MDISQFFPPGARVLALPSWENPRLYLSAEHPLQRWAQSSLYPASRLSARLYRLSLRFRTAATSAEVRTVRSSGWPLRDFTRDLYPNVAYPVVLMGTAGPAQEVTVQLRDVKNRILGYLKYAETPAALRRLRHEHFILRNLPLDVGPEPLKHGELGNGEAVLKNELPGNLLPASLPPKACVSELLAALHVLPAVSLESHPWVRRMRELGAPELDVFFESMANREWPVVIQHGDFAPWNLIKDPRGVLRATDWEYGTLESLPFLDLVYYMIQVSALIYRRTPDQAVQYVTRYLTRRPGFKLDEAEARALIGLTAYDAYQKSLEDGPREDTSLQAWRKSIWQGMLPAEK